MRTEKEIIEAMLELQQRITRCKSINPDVDSVYFKDLTSKLEALKYVVGIKDTIV